MRNPHPRRDEALHRLNQPGGPSVGTLAEELGVSKVTIYGWLQGSRKRALLAASQAPVGGRQVTSRKGRTRSPSEKLRLVQESESLKGDALAAFLREHGTTAGEVMTWRDLMLGGLERREDESPRSCTPPHRRGAASRLLATAPRRCQAHLARPGHSWHRQSAGQNS